MKALVMAAAFALATAGAFAQEKHTHDHGDGKEHAHASEGHTHGEPQDLGTTTVASLKLQVFQLGKLEEKEAAFEVVLAKASPELRAVRMWVGVESAEGSVKAKADKVDNAYEAHVELPNPMPKSAKLWIEVQPAEGKKAKVAFDLKK